MIHDLHNKRVLLIGSSADMDGRAMQTAIDEAGTYDLIARINKAYGSAEDTGTRTDIIFVRRREWANWYFHRCDRHPRPQDEHPPLIVAFRDGVSCDRTYAADVAAELGLPKASTGLLAAKWLIDHGASVECIGFGFSGGVPAKAKVYAVTHETDPNLSYDWSAEAAWLQEHVTLI